MVIAGEDPASYSLIDHNSGEIPNFEVLPQLPMPSGIDHRKKPTTVSLFEGSPAYKQRKRKGARDSTLKQCEARESLEDDDDATADGVADEDCGPTDDEDSVASSPRLKIDQSSPRASPLLATMMPAVASEACSLNAHGRDSGTLEPGEHRDGTVYITRPISNAMSHDLCAAPTETGLRTSDNLAAIAFARLEQKPPIAQSQGSWHVPYLPGLHLPTTTTHRSTAGIHEHRSATVTTAGAKRTFSQSTNDSDYAQDSAGSLSDSGGAGASGRMFQCPLDTCGRLFKRLEHLKRHVRTHTQERPYACTRCGKRFSRSDNLTQHIKIHDKANRSDRGKTDFTDDEDLVKVLEARVEAMRGQTITDVHPALHFYDSSGPVADAGLYVNGGNHVERGRYLAHLRSSMLPPFAAARSTFYQNLPHQIYGNEIERSNSVHPHLFAANSQFQLPNTSLHSRSQTRSPSLPSTSYRFGHAQARVASSADVLAHSQALGRPRTSINLANRYSPYSATRPTMPDGSPVRAPVTDHSTVGVNIPSGTMLRYMDQTQPITSQKRFLHDPAAASLSQQVAIEADSAKLNRAIVQGSMPHSIIQTDYQCSGPVLAADVDSARHSLLDAHTTATPNAFLQNFDPLAFTTQKGMTSTFPTVSPDTLAFRGMLVTASYDPESAMWPVDAASPSDHGFHDSQPSQVRKPDDFTAED